MVAIWMTGDTIQSYRSHSNKTVAICGHSSNLLRTTIKVRSFRSIDAMPLWLYSIINKCWYVTVLWEPQYTTLAYVTEYIALNCFRPILRASQFLRTVIHKNYVRPNYAQKNNLKWHLANRISVEPQFASVFSNPFFNLRRNSTYLFKNTLQLDFFGIIFPMPLIWYSNTLRWRIIVPLQSNIWIRQMKCYNLHANHFFFDHVQTKTTITRPTDLLAWCVFTQ